MGKTALILTGLLCAFGALAATSTFVASPGTDRAIEVFPDTHNNYEDTPKSVASHMRWEHPIGTTSNMVTGMFTQMDFQAADDPIHVLYLEVDSNQGGADGLSDTWAGPAIQVVHRGGGDAFWCPMRDNDSNNSVCYEAQLLGGNAGAKREIGYLARLAGTDSVHPEAYYKQSYAVGFQVLIAATVDESDFHTAKGLFYADNSIGASYVARRSPYSLAGYRYFGLTENSPVRMRWGAYGSGDLHLWSLTATAINPEYDSPAYAWRGHYWAAAAEHESGAYVKASVPGTHIPYMQFWVGDVGSEVLALQFGNDIMHLQSNALDFNSLIQDGNATGASQNALWSAAGNNWDGADDWETNAQIEMVSGDDPYLRWSVDDDCTAGNGVLTDVFDMHDDAWVPTTDGTVDLGIPEYGFRAFHVDGIKVINPAEPFACDINSTGTIVRVDDTDDGATVSEFCGCIATMDDGAGTPNAFDWVQLADNGAACTKI